MNTTTVSIDTFQYNTTSEPAIYDMPGLHAKPKKDLRTGEFHLILNPNTYVSDTNMLLTYSECEASILNMFSELDVHTGRFQRIDFAYDSYIQHIYATMYKTNYLLMALINNRYKAKSFYYCTQADTNKENSINIKSEYFDVECYDKESKEPDQSVTCRLEFRVKRISKMLKEQEELPTKTIISESWNRVKNILQTSITSENYTELLDGYTYTLLTKYAESGYTKKKDIDFVLAENLNLIFSNKQLETVYEAMEYADAKQKAARFIRKHGVEKVPFTQVKKYVDDILKCGKMFFLN